MFLISFQNLLTPMKLKLIKLKMILDQNFVIKNRDSTSV